MLRIYAFLKRWEATKRQTGLFKRIPQSGRKSLDLADTFLPVAAILRTEEP
jgi:hypothetical protein